MDTSFRLQFTCLFGDGTSAAMNVVCVILGGGRGTRLMPLTRERSKPAVPIAGKYRLVDIPISNCIHSRLRNIFLLTQFNSVSLHEHVQGTYRFDPYHKGHVRILAAQQTPSSTDWFQGTADAVRQTFSHFMDDRPDLILILSGDQLYRMNFAEVIEQHLDTGADVTISTKPVQRHEAGELGIMRVDDQRRIVEFVEKPGDTPALDGLRAPMYDDERYLASMGIYVFNTAVLEAMLASDRSDFGGEIIPASIAGHQVFSYVYDGYWRDIGTIRSFWETNLALTDVVPEFTFYDASAPIYTHMRYLPPTKVNRCALERCLMSEGCIVSGKRIHRSVIGIRSVIGDGTTIENTVMMGADEYDFPNSKPDAPPIGIGKNCEIRNAIIDKNARIGHGCVISPDGKEDGAVTDQYTVRSNVIVVPKNTIVPDGTRL